MIVRKCSHLDCVLGVLLAWVVVSSMQARGESIIDLAHSATAFGTDGQGAWFYNVEPQPTGTGVIRPFLTIQHNITEKGYNTDFEPQFDEKRSTQYNHALPTNTIDPVTMGGMQYAKFLLDINESDSGIKPLLSLNKLQLWSTDDSMITGYTDVSSTDGTLTPGFSPSKANKIYDLDGAGDQRLELNYHFGSGSGSGDMYAFIPYSLIANAKGKYLVLFSSFGNPNKSDAGFEEWAASTRTPVQAVPVPAAASMGLALMGSIAGAKLLKGRRQNI